MAKNYELLKTRIEELKRRNDELVVANQALKEFASVASHDLQEPLRVLTGFIDLALNHSERMDKETQEYLEIAHDEANRAQTTVKKLLEYAEVSSGKQNFAVCDFNNLFLRVQKILQCAISESEAVITSDPLPSLYADSFRMVQLLQNLLSNSIKYRSSRPLKIHFSAIRKGENWLFSIRDNGLGIEPQFQSKVFGIFERIHPEQCSGTGLGLAICKKIIENHSGKIWVESVYGEGSAFFFSLPICP